MKTAELLKYLNKLNDIKHVILPADQIVIDPRVRFQCRFSGCGEYGRNLMCPPNVPELAEFKEVVDKYEKALLVVMEKKLDPEKNMKKQSDEYAIKLHNIIYKIERKAFSLGFYFAAGLIGGSCKLCDICSNDISNCRYKNKARPSMEAMGINVLETGRKAGLSLEFEPEKVKWTGLVLLE